MKVKIPEQNRQPFTFAMFFGVAGIVLSVIRLDILWVLTSILYVILIYGVMNIKREDNIQRDLFIWTPVPFFFGITGISTFIGRVWPFGDIAFAAFAPIMGFMIILNLTYHTRFETNLYFSASFIFLFTLAAGGFMSIVRFLSDRHLGTEYIAGNDPLMIELFVITIIGFLGAVLFKHYRKRYYLKWESFSILNKIRSKFEIDSEKPSEDFLNILSSFFGGNERYHLLLISRLLPIGIITLALFSLFTSNLWAFSVALPSFVLSLIPYFYEHFLKKKVPVTFQFWISLSLFFYVFGETIGLQRRLSWWNELTHFIAGMVVGILILIFIFYLDQISERLYLPNWSRGLLVMTFILSIGVVWELFEFSIDSIFGTRLQGGLEDTIYDMMANTIGAFFALVITSMLTPFEALEPASRKTKSFRQKFKSFFFRSKRYN